MKMGLDYLEKGEGKALVRRKRVQALIASGGGASKPVSEETVRFFCRA